MNKKLINKLISNMMTLIPLFLMFINTHVYATGKATVVDQVLTEVTQVLLVVGGLVCVGKLIHIGILYLTASAVDKSNAKTALFPWLVGTIVCFGAAWIGKAIINVFRVDGNVLDY